MDIRYKMGPLASSSLDRNTVDTSAEKGPLTTSRPLNHIILYYIPVVAHRSRAAQGP